MILALLSYPHLHISARNNAAFTALDYAYSVGLQTHMAAATKEVYEERRARKMLGSHSREGEMSGAGFAASYGARTGSFVSDDSAARGYRQQLRAKASMGTLLSEESAGGGGSGRGSDVSYNGPRQATPPHPGPQPWASPRAGASGLSVHDMPSHVMQSPVSMRSGIVGRGEASPSLRGASRRGDSALSPGASPSRQRSDSYRSVGDGSSGGTGVPTLDLSRLAVSDATRRSPSKVAAGTQPPLLSPVSDLPSLAPPPPGRPSRHDARASSPTSPVQGDGEVGLGVGPVPPPRG